MACVIKSRTTRYARSLPCGQNGRPNLYVVKGNTMANYPNITLDTLNPFHMQNLKDHILNYDNVMDAYRKSRLGDGKYKASSARFHRDAIVNIDQLVTELDLGLYSPGAYDSFTVYEPKERIIHAPRYRDKIVQHMVNNVLAPLFKQIYIADSYACIEGKGNLKAVRQLQNFYRRADQAFGGQVYLIKADVKKFFYTINREILKTILTKYIYCPWTLSLLFRIIDSSPGDIGLPLGNLTSQMFANILMNELDQKAKRELGVPFYLRYADDIFGFTNSSYHAHSLLSKIKLSTVMDIGLTMHPGKSSIRKLGINGLDGLGFKIHLNRIDLSSQCKRKIKYRLNRINLEGMSTMMVRDIQQSVNGWLTHSRVGNGEHFVEYLLAKYPYLNMGSNNLFELTV